MESCVSSMPSRSCGAQERRELRKRLLNRLKAGLYWGRNRRVAPTVSSAACTLVC